MKNFRPYTAERQVRTLKPENRATTAKGRRPATAKSDSLKKIIQVIENTLSKGAQTLQAKTKTLDKFSKVKNQSLDFSRFRLFKLKTKGDREIPQFRTEFLIGNNSEILRSTPAVKSSKKLLITQENDEFVPYMKQPQLVPEFDDPKKDVTLKKIGRNRAQHKENKTETTVDFKLIDKWENESSALNMSYLLDDLRWSRC